jgi:hypothetical protein
MNPKQIIDQRITRGTFLFQKFCDLELVNATMPCGLPFVANKQPIGFWGKDETPPIFIGGCRATRAPVKLSLDSSHLLLAPSIALR